MAGGNEHSIGRFAGCIGKGRDGNAPEGATLFLRIAIETDHRLHPQAAQMIDRPSPEKARAIEADALAQRGIAQRNSFPQ